MLGDLAKLSLGWGRADASHPFTADHRGAGSIGEHCHRAGFDRRGGELGAMRGCARKGGEQVTGSGILGPQGDASDTQIRKILVIGGHRTHPGRQRGQRQTRGGAGAQHTGHRRHPTERVASRRGGGNSISAGQAACSVSGGPGSGESGTFSRCSSQPAMLWNSGAAE